MMVAVGMAILVAPMTLGSLADEVGLRLAHLTVPVLVLAALASFLIAGVMKRNTLRAAGP